MIRLSHCLYCSVSEEARNSSFTGSMNSNRATVREKWEKENSSDATVCYSVNCRGVSRRRSCREQYHGEMPCTATVLVCLPQWGHRTHWASRNKLLTNPIRISCRTKLVPSILTYFFIPKRPESFAPTKITYLSEDPPDFASDSKISESEIFYVLVRATRTCTIV